MGRSRAEVYQCKGKSDGESGCATLLLAGIKKALSQLRVEGLSLK